MLAAVGMRIPIHGQGDRRMAGQGLGSLGVDAARREVADKRVPQGVEVDHSARFVAIRDARFGKVGFGKSMI